ncbi:alpha/beta hydrolase [Variovorax rhizosphaerae]|uniref:Alpha/beta hydrolase n=1 Tax=Variovorax rhizosphaerae TaxID=1836200 RepID=A0ABU8WKR1_9BURK
MQQPDTGNSVWGWMKRKSFNWMLRKQARPMWLRPNLTAADMQHFVDQLGARLPARDAMPGRPEYIPQHCEGEWFEPVGIAPKRVLLYLHGGAWITRAPRVYRGFARRLAQQLEARVFLPDYRLAPEFRFPVGSDDCLAAYKHVLAQGVSPSQFLIGGDSAGGNLTLVTLLRARDEGLPLPACAFTFSAATDLAFTGDSVRMNALKDVMFMPQAAAFVQSQYLNDPAEVNNPWASPLYGDLKGLPPLLMQVSDTELLLDDSRRFVDKVRAAGGRAELSIWPDLPHVFQVARFLNESQAGLNQVEAFVRHITTSNSKETTT